MSEASLIKLTTGGQQLLQAAMQIKEEYRHDDLGVNHWLLALLERHPAMAADLVTDLDPAALARDLRVSLGRGEMGSALGQESAIDQALEAAEKRGKSQAAERDLATAILAGAGYMPQGGGDGAHAENQKNISGKQSPAAAATPALDLFGKDLTQAARDGKLPQLTGRAAEIQLMVETLCRRTKRNPVLVGPAGVGKTAIVEGLAQRVAQGQAPDLLKNVRIIELQPSSIMAGAGIVGEKEERMKKIIQEAAQEGIILFIDEIHSLMGAGGASGASDLSSLLKPALARGDLACIAATTDDEYRRFITSDAAFERRFQPIRINELSPEETLDVLKIVRADLYRRKPVQVDDEVLQWLVSFSKEYMRNRRFPDKAVDLLEQAYASALANGASELHLDQAQQVAQRMVGMPLSFAERLEKLRQALAGACLLSEEEIDRIHDLLQVTLRGLDLRNDRPNAVIVLNDKLGEHSEDLAQAVAEALYGDRSRVISIDFSRMLHPADISLLVGSPPGYVGYNESLPLHGLEQTPWCVLRFQRLDLCHPSILQFVANGLMDGRIVDGRGRSIYWSDTVVLVTTNLPLETTHRLGFQGGRVEPPAAQDTLAETAGRLMGEEFAAQVDLFLPLKPGEPVKLLAESIEDVLLKSVAQKFLEQRLVVHWDASLLDWLLQQRQNRMVERDLERWVDTKLTPALIPYLRQPGHWQPVSIVVRIESGQLLVRQKHSEEGDQENEV